MQTVHNVKDHNGHKRIPEDAVPEQCRKGTPLPLSCQELHELGPEAGGARLEAGRGAPGGAAEHTFDLLSDVSLNVRIELGRSKMAVEDILKLQSGSVVTLDKLAGDFVDVLVNDRLVARGEVLILNDNFCVRIAEIISPEERLGQT